MNAIIDCGASAPVIGEKIAKRLGVWRRAHKITIRQGDGSRMKGGDTVANTQITIPIQPCSMMTSSASSLAKSSASSLVKSSTSSLSTTPIFTLIYHKTFLINAEILDISNRELILELS